MIHHTSSVGVDGVAAALAELCKACWRQTASLTRLSQRFDGISADVKSLGDEVRLLAEESDLLSGEIEEVAKESGSGTASSLADVNHCVWDCLASQIEDADRALKQCKLQQPSSSLAGSSSSIGNGDGPRVDDSEAAGFTSKLRRATNNLKAIRILIRCSVTLPAAHDASGQDLSHVILELQSASEAIEFSQTVQLESILLLCAQQIAAKLSSHSENSSPHSGTSTLQGRPSEASHDLKWIHDLQRVRHRSQIEGTKQASHTRADSSVSTIKPDMAEGSRHQRSGVDPIHDLEVDLAHAALGEGIEAFDHDNWAEADCMFKEVINCILKLPATHSSICNLFDLHARLAVCAYHLQVPAYAEQALTSLVTLQDRQEETTDIAQLYQATHLLALTHIRMGQIGRAKTECEKALHGRRHSQGKQSSAAMESLALMAHILTVSDERSRAKSYLAMIPQAQRATVVASIEQALGSKSEPIDISSMSIGSSSHASSIIEKSELCRLSLASSVSVDPLPAADSNVTTPGLASEAGSQGRLDEQPTSPMSPARQQSFSEIVAVSGVAIGPTPKVEVGIKKSIASAPEHTKLERTTSSKPLARKEILERVKCRPRDRIEDAVCEGNETKLAAALDKEKGFWRSKMRKRAQAERVTALHFAALLGEVRLAKRLVEHHFDVNEAPYGYSTNLTPLKFAIGARQTDMVAFLLANGARPSGPDTWANLASQVLNRSWLQKTTSEYERPRVPGHAIAIWEMLLQHGWSVNEPYEAAGSTILHQVVTFWMGAHASKHDMDLRVTLATFLCNNGANPSQKNRDNDTPYELAQASGHQALTQVLDRVTSYARPYGDLVEPAELPGHYPSGAGDVRLERFGP